MSFHSTRQLWLVPISIPESSQYFITLVHSQDSSKSSSVLSSIWSWCNQSSSDWDLGFIKALWSIRHSEAPKWRGRSIFFQFSCLLSITASYNGKKLLYTWITNCLQFWSSSASNILISMPSCRPCSACHIIIVLPCFLFRKVTSRYIIWCHI
jgi:hypothetical protein